MQIAMNDAIAANCYVSTRASGVSENGFRIVVSSKLFAYVRYSQERQARFSPKVLYQPRLIEERILNPVRPLFEHTAVAEHTCPESWKSHKDDFTHRLPHELITVAEEISTTAPHV